MWILLPVLEYLTKYFNISIADFCFIPWPTLPNWQWGAVKNDKIYHLNFPIVNLPFICSNIPAAPAYGVYISQLISGAIMISLIGGCCYHTSYWTKGSSWLSWSRHFESFTVATMTWLTAMKYIICATNDHGCVPLVVNTSRSFPHSWHISRFVTRLTRRVPLMKQELITLPEHEFTIGFSGFVILNL